MNLGEEIETTRIAEPEPVAFPEPGQRETPMPEPAEHPEPAPRETPVHEPMETPEKVPV